MAYVIVQTSLDTPTADQLGAAFATLPQYTKFDGQHASRDAYGILAEGLTRDDADALCKALADQGVGTIVEDKSEIPQLPSPHRVRRALATDNGLVLYDALGREDAIAWETIKLLAIGLVAEEQFERGNDELILTDAGIMTMPGDHEAVPQLVRYIDLLRDEEPRRYQINGAEFRYDGLGDLMTDDWQANFGLLVEQLVERVTDHAAVLNRGARDMVGPRDSALAYPSRHGYEEEIEWLLWHARRKATT